MGTIVAVTTTGSSRRASSEVALRGRGGLLGLFDLDVLGQAHEGPGQREQHNHRESPHGPLLLARKGWDAKGLEAGLLTRGSARASSPSHPRRGQWLRRTDLDVAPHTQWRDRAGLSSSSRTGFPHREAVMSTRARSPPLRPRHLHLQAAVGERPLHQDRTAIDSTQQRLLQNFSRGPQTRDPPLGEQHEAIA